MNQLIAALGNNIKPSGKNWTARCPVHNDKDFAMSISQCNDGSVIAHCHACGANGMDLYRTLGLDLKELFGGKERDSFIPNFIVDQYKEDRLVVAIYDADKEAGKNIKLVDKKRHRLALSRMDGIKNKYKDISIYC